MYFPENMTAAYFFFDTYPGYFLQALPIALLAGGLWAFRLRKTVLPLPERLRSVLFACYLTGLFCLTLFQPVIAELYRLLFGLPGAGLRWSVNFSFRLSLDFHRRFDSENLFNLLMFLPFGFLCPGNRTGSGWLRTAAAGPGLSCAIELLQPFFGRSFDCNDILLNALGALIGAVLSGLLARWYAARTRSVSL